MSDAALAFLASLQETQYETPARTLAYQRRLQERLVRHARAETDFYKDRLAPLFGSDDSIDWERWTEISVLTRREAQEAGETLSAKCSPPQAGETIESLTSGSTGTPLRHLNSAIQRLASAAANERYLNWHGVLPAELAAFIRAKASGRAEWPSGESQRGWRLGHPNSLMQSLNVTTPVDRQVEWLRRIRPQILIAYPSVVREIGRTMRTDGGSMLQISHLITTGETLDAAMREEMTDQFGLSPFDQYGSAETGHIAASCPQTSLHHIAAELALVEILGPDDRPLPAGETGRIVVTSFYNFATPFIRYDLGDYGSLATEPCPCGRTLPRFERILGRSHHAFRFDDGSVVWPILRPSQIQPFIRHRQYQVVQLAPNIIEYRYVPEAPDQVNDPEEFRAYVAQALRPGLDIRIVAVNAIPRAPSGKYEDYVSLVTTAKDKR